MSQRGSNRQGSFLGLSVSLALDGPFLRQLGESLMLLRAQRSTFSTPWRGLRHRWSFMQATVVTSFEILRHFPQGHRPQLAGPFFPPVYRTIPKFPLFPLSCFAFLRQHLLGVVRGIFLCKAYECLQVALTVRFFSSCGRSNITAPF